MDSLALQTIGKIDLVLGIMVKLCLAYSRWSNENNEKNHASCDLIIRKLMEDKKSPLMDS